MSSPLRVRIGLPVPLVAALLVVFLFALGSAYYAKGLYQLARGTQRIDAVDLRQKWIEYRYFARRTNPFDVWLQHGPYSASPEATRSRISRPVDQAPELGISDPASPPWSLVPGLLLMWPEWPVVRVYFATLNGLTGLTLALVSFALLAQRGRQTGWLAAAFSVAMGAATSAIAVGQYSLLVTVTLAGVLVLDRSGHYGTAGTLMALALVKPTMSAPFAVACLLAGRWRLVTTTMAICAVTSLAAWWWIRTDPVELLRQLSMVGQYLSAGGTLSPTQLLARSGYGHAVSVLGPMLVGALIQVAAVSTVRKGSLLAIFGISAVIARLWSYHYSHDDTMMIFLLLALLDHVSASRAYLTAGLLVAVAGTLVMPGTVIGIRGFQYFQFGIWIIAAAHLWWLERVAPTRCAQTERRPGVDRRPLESAP